MSIPHGYWTALQYSLHTTETMGTYTVPIRLAIRVIGCGRMIHPHGVNLGLESGFSSVSLQASTQAAILHDVVAVTSPVLLITQIRYRIRTAIVAFLPLHHLCVSSTANAYHFHPAASSRNSYVAAPAFCLWHQPYIAASMPPRPSSRPTLTYANVASIIIIEWWSSTVATVPLVGSRWMPRKFLFMLHCVYSFLRSNSYLWIKDGL